MFGFITRKSGFVCGVTAFTVLCLAPVFADNVHDTTVSETPSVKDIIFLDASWDSALLKVIEEGPRILPRETNFDVVAPPANDSDMTRAELDYILELAQQSRDEGTVARIRDEHAGKKAHEIFMAEGLLHRDNFKTDALMRMIDADHSYFILERKKHFSRPRPNQLESKLETVLPNPGHAAYPSGHASQLYMVALVLSDFDTEHTDLYKQFSYDVAHRREIAGFHYPSDSIAGRQLAVDVLKKLRENATFEKKYQDAKLSYVKPDDVAVEKYNSYLDMRGDGVARMQAIEVEWQNIGIQLR